MGSGKRSQNEARDGDVVMKKLLLTCATLMLATLLANANELLLRCNWGVVTAGVKVDLDNSVVTEIYAYASPSEVRYRANITGSLIEWRVGPNGTRKINRVTGETAEMFDSSFKPLYGRCTKTEGF
jgi:hypothetical protein